MMHQPQSKLGRDFQRRRDAHRNYAGSYDRGSDPTADLERQSDRELAHDAGSGGEPHHDCQMGSRPRKLATTPASVAMATVA